MFICSMLQMISVFVVYIEIIRRRLNVPAYQTSRYLSDIPSSSNV